MKRLIRLTFIFAIMCFLFTTTNLPAIADGPPTSGQCGDNVEWEVNGCNLEFKLIDHGYEGVMWDTNGNPAWSPYRDVVENVDFHSGVTSVGAQALFNFKNVKSISMPTITTVSRGAFSGCSSLVDVAPLKVTYIGSSGFYGCASLVAIRLPKIVYIDRWAFWHCSNLRRVSLIRPEFMADNAFGMCHPDLTFYYYGETLLSYWEVSNKAYHCDESDINGYNINPTIFYPGYDSENWIQEIENSPDFTWKEWNPPLGHLLQCETYEIESGEKEVSFAAIDLDEDCEIIIGFFKNNELISVQVFPITKEEYFGETFTMTDKDDCDCVKVLVWDKLINAKPIEPPIKTNLKAK